ncbi:family 4 glycosyl hydrolase [Luteipulveratus halotolerans]|uniref:6-phospho-beta-glucosidase n=1 Tax=Luteipulveratus halotolerans TaxID=1631356 RepID=A0A0L6CL92_9MICO|nr:6-phospho-beta-glucosidase [Luteipulveratus halotolerans]KNX38298.1 6-phospho-beta-glucosidase [Luteipulveratus halotolerans]
MKVTVLGGGGFRTPLLYSALQRDPALRSVSEVVLYDVDVRRLLVMDLVLSQLRADGGGPSVRTTSLLEDAVGGAAFVLSAIRVGGLDGRAIDERVALDADLLGQETTGPGGVAYGLRTVPVAVEVAEAVAAYAPGAWVINLTNPAGLVTEAMQAVLGERVVGVCDSPTRLGRRASSALGIRTDSCDYVGLNHLGWLRTLPLGRTDVLPALLADTRRLTSFEEGRLFGAEWLQDLGMIPSEYLYYFYFTRDAISAIKGGPETRGEYLLYQQTRFYNRVYTNPRNALRQWQFVRGEREASYGQERRDSGRERDPEAVLAGGYEQVAVAVLRAIVSGEPERLVVNVRNGTTLPWLPADAVVEVPCTVGREGPRPDHVAPLTGHPAGLVHQVKAVEQLVIRAARERSERLARQAMALHPLVDSAVVARQLLWAYRSRIPSLDAVFA